MNRLLTAAIVLAASSAASAQDKWKPYQFKADERYEFRITETEGGKAKEVFYVMDIKSTGKKDAEGEELLEVSYTTRGTMKKSELGEKTLFGAWDMQGYGMAWAIVNALYGALFADLTLKEGEKLSLLGLGLVKVTGKAKVADRDGFIVQFFGKEDEKEVLNAEWIVDPALALPIKTTNYEGGKAKSVIELVSYKKS